MRSSGRHARSGAVLAAVAMVLASAGSAAAADGGPAAPASPPGQYGQLPADSGTPLAGGTVSVAEAPGAVPNWIFPITPSAYDSVYDTYQFQDYQWRPLWWAPQGVTPVVDPS